MSPAAFIWFVLRPSLLEGGGLTSGGGGFSPWLGVWLSAGSGPALGVEIFQGLARGGEGRFEAGITPPAAAKLAAWSLIPSFRPLPFPIPNSLHSPLSAGTLNGAPFRAPPCRIPQKFSLSYFPPPPPVSCSPTPTPPPPPFAGKGKNHSSLNRLLGARQDLPVRQEGLETWGLEGAPWLENCRKEGQNASPADALFCAPPRLPEVKQAEKGHRVLSVDGPGKSPKQVSSALQASVSICEMSESISLLAGLLG